MAHIFLWLCVYQYAYPNIINIYMNIPIWEAFNICLIFKQIIIYEEILSPVKQNTDSHLSWSLYWQIPKEGHDQKKAIGLSSTKTLRDWRMVYKVLIEKEGHNHPSSHFVINRIRQANNTKPWSRNGTMATNAGQNMDGSSYKLSQQPRWNVTMCKQKIASICKTSIQSISGASVHASFNCQVSKLTT